MTDDALHNDDDLVRHLRDHVSTVAAPSRPSLAAIASRGRTHRRRRTASFTGIGVTGVAAGIALAFGLSGAPAGGTAAIQDDAFTLTSNANGTDTLTLPMKQVLDPAIFQRALTQHHIPALVKSGVVCDSRPEPANPVFSGIWTNPRPTPPQPGQLQAGAVVVINPAKIPSGTEMFFGYTSSDRAMFLNVITIDSYTCRSQPPPR